MAVQPLSPATDRRLGGPLPRQLANQTRAHLSAIKSLASKSCDLDALCGISSRFRLLSPSERQIAHALLTRPPLSHRFQFRRTFQNDSVRLACVRHAASVHPEPGSNSLKNCINTKFPSYQSFKKLFALYFPFHSFECSGLLFVLSYAKTL